SYQKQLFNRHVRRDGTRKAKTYSARPGYSEHQTGLAVDLSSRGAGHCELRACFGGTLAGRWLKKESWRFGFIVRYTRANRAITGYIAEPWHLRFVGLKLSRYYYNHHVNSLEQFFDVTGGGYTA